MGFLSSCGHQQLHHFFEKSVDTYPDNIALICDNAFLSYQELDNRANQLAHYLLQNNITKGSIVAILLDRSVDCYIAILAVLKVGAAYVPIEVDYPDERINYIFDDLTFAAVLTSTEQAQRHLKWPRAILLNKITEQLSALAISRITHDPDELVGDNLCYVIYTSGSTGKPKGVENTHKSICHYVEVASQIYEMSDKDKVYQGFSLAFDASLEELWMAFANGAALIACTSKEVRSGIGLISFLMQYKVSVLSSVPTLLSTLEGPLPDLRLLILGGETCPVNLVKRWSNPDLRILNTYGPTEASVIATYAECHPDKEVTIGRPLPGYEVLILDEHLKEVEAGKEGELCIAGLALARGYVNRPESTAEKFIINPNNLNQRLYRTGDLALITSTGDIQFAGRIDDQVKLRGFRIELNEIENVIMQYEGIDQAVVSLQTLDQAVLVAYLRIDNKKHFDLDSFRIFLRSSLPDYMIPSLVELVKEFPLLASGKINRKALPKPTQVKANKEYKGPVSELEKKITFAWEQSLNCSNISIDADFFYDLGGHSLHAAQIISNLRKISELRNISILDLYKNPSIEKLAEKFTDSVVTEEPVQRIKYTAPKWKFYLCSLAQFFGILFQYAIGSWQLMAVYFLYFWTTVETASLSRESQLAFLYVFLLLPIISLGLTVAMKWLLLGRMKPGVYPLWGWFYFRWWLAHRLVIGSFFYKYLIGTPLMAIYYRLLGAKVGKNCHIATPHVFTFDLLSIGNNSSIGAESKLPGYLVEDGWLKCGSINIGNNCYIGSRSVVGLDTCIEDNTVIEEMSMIPDGAVLTTGMYYAGSPATPAPLPADHVTSHKVPIEEPGVLENTWFGFLHYMGILLLMTISILCFIPGLSLVDYFYGHDSYFITIFVATPLGAVLCLCMHYLFIIACKKVIMPKIKPGIYPLKGFYYLRYWIIKELMDTEDVSIMSDTLYLPMFLRLLGAKLGKQVEMGEAPQIIPELLTIEDGGFAASSVALGWPQVYKDSICFAPVTIGKKAFAGNVSFLSAGKTIGEGGLLGCLSITPTNTKATDPHTSWLGSPALFLPKRESFTGYSEEATYNPPKRLYLTRLFIEFIRIIIPTTFSLIILYNLVYVMDFMFRKFSLLTTALVLPIAEFLIIAALMGALIALKWIIVGKLKPLTKPLWDIFIWKNDLVEFTYSYFICPNFVDLALGSPWALVVPRLLGSKIGKRVYCDTNAFAEFDLITIGDDVCINIHTLIQTHLYEDRIFKVSNLTINSGCNIGVSSIILYNTLMEENATLGSLSLLMKGERLPTNTEWAGIPAQSRQLGKAERLSLHVETVAAEKEAPVEAL